MANDEQHGCHHATTASCFRKVLSRGRMKRLLGSRWRCWFGGTSRGGECLRRTAEPAPACNVPSASTSPDAPSPSPASLPVSKSATPPAGSSAPQRLLGDEGLLGWRLPADRLAR